MVTGDELRGLMRLWPHGVSILSVDVEGDRMGVTVSSLVSLSLEPPLVGISLALSASLYEVLRDAGDWTVSMLAADQEQLAQHFARSVPPLVQWDGIAVRGDDPRLLEHAVGWLHARTVEEIPAGDHTVFIGAVERLEQGPGRGALVYWGSRYQAL